MLPNDWLTRSGGTDKTTHIIAQLLARRIPSAAEPPPALPALAGLARERSEVSA